MFGSESPNTQHHHKIFLPSLTPTLTVDIARSTPTMSSRTRTYARRRYGKGSGHTPKATPAKRSLEVGNDDDLIERKPLSPTKPKSPAKRRIGTVDELELVTPKASKHYPETSQSVRTSKPSQNKPKKQEKQEKPEKKSSDSIWAELDSVIENSAVKASAIKTISPHKKRKLRPFGHFDEDDDQLEDTVETDRADRVNRVDRVVEEEQIVPGSPHSRGIKQRLKLLSSLNSKTYGAVRSVVDGNNDGDRHKDDLNLDLESESMSSVAATTDTQPLDEDYTNTLSSSSIVNVQSVNDLKAQGVNAEFLSDLEYIMEGLSMGVSSQQSTLVELVEKCQTNEDDFVYNFRSTQYAVEIVELATSCNNDVTELLVGWIINKLFKDGGDSLAAMMIRDYALVELLLKMVGDSEDVLAKKSVDKTIKKSIRTLIQNETGGDGSGSKHRTISRQWIALNALSSLEAMNTTVQLLLQEKLSSKATTFLNLISDDDSENSAAHSEAAALVAVQLLFILQTIEPAEIQVIVEATDNHVEALMNIAVQFYRGDSSIALAGELITKLAVMLSTKFASIDLLHYSVFRHDLAGSICEYLGKHPLKDIPGSLLVYASGLLYNLMDSEGICELISTSEHSQFIDNVLNYKHTPQSPQNTRTAVSYLYLVLKRLHSISAGQRQKLDTLMKNHMDKTVARLNS